MTDKKKEEKGVWRFFKLKETDNIIQWKRNMIIAMKSTYLYNWIDDIKVLFVEMFMNIMKAESWIKTNIREYQQKIENYNLKNIVLKTESKECATSTLFKLSISKTNQSKRFKTLYWHDINYKNDQRSERWWTVLKNWVTSTKSQSKS